MKYIFTLFVGIVFVLPVGVSANLIITEIMYDPPGSDDQEWFEVFNQGSESVLIRGGSKPSGGWSVSSTLEEKPESEITTTDRKNLAEGMYEILPGHYAIFAKNNSLFLENHPIENVVMQSSTLSLQNTGDRTIRIFNSNAAVVARADYETGAETKGTGASLQLQPDGTWIAGLPTPGEENTSIEFIMRETLGDGGAVGDDFISLESEWPSSPDHVYVSIIGDNKRAFEGEEILFEVETKKRNGDSVRVSSVRWSFGDGEGSQRSSAFHSYRRPGVYRVVVTVAYQGRVFQDAIRVHVVDEEIISVTVDDEYVEFKNESDFEVDISGWDIESGREKKVLADDTYILPGETVAVFHGFAGDSIEVYSPRGRKVREHLRSEQGILDSSSQRIMRILERLSSGS